MLVNKAMSVLNGANLEINIVCTLVYPKINRAKSALLLGQLLQKIVANKKIIQMAKHSR
jgi:hypothetical protein